MPSADGRQVLVTAERDGDTVSPERGIYLVSLDARVTASDVLARIDASLAAEKALRAKGERMFRPIAAGVKRALAEVSTPRIYGYEKALFDFDSKHITKPGNKLAGEYLFNTYRSFGYEPEYQWFEPRGALGGKSANVLATLKGTENPEIVYVVSSHYDSNASGPGADDDSSATAALLEAARVLAKRPMPATIVFASFTGEESGLLGSREFVRRAQEGGMRIVGALNNDMIGWANDHRLDNTIRYSNAGIRDVQHAASFLTKLITYDARYFKSTDAASYFEAYGDIVGGIGSYPVLGNPHYHQPTDLLETVNHELVAETSKVTVASIMLLASSPSPVKDLKAAGPAGGPVSVTWAASPEKSVTGYIVAWGPADAPLRNTMRVVKPAATIPGAAPGMTVSVKAVNARGPRGVGLGQRDDQVEVRDKARGEREAGSNGVLPSRLPLLASRLPSVHHPVLHHEHHLARGGDVARRVAGDGDEVREVAGLHEAEPVAPAHHLGVHDRRGHAAPARASCRTRPSAPVRARWCRARRRPRRCRGR